MNILVVDDHTLFREGLVLLLRELDETVTVLQAGSVEAAAEHAGSPVDLVLLDYHLPTVRGADALRAVREHFDAPVIMVSGEEDARRIREVVDAGAAGYLLKDSSLDMLVAALRTILAGALYLPPEAFLREAPPENGAPRALEALSPRQRQVLQRALQGKANKVIAREMDIAEGTVKAHLSAVFRSLGVRNRTEAVYELARLGLPLDGAAPRSTGSEAG